MLLLLVYDLLSRVGMNALPAPVPVPVAVRVLMAIPHSINSIAPLALPTIMFARHARAQLY